MIESENYHDEKSLKTATSLLNSSKNNNNNNYQQKLRKTKVAFKEIRSASIDLEPNAPERYTPNTELNDFPQDIFEEAANRPDISITCKTCKLFIDLDDLNDHKNYHEALSILGLNQQPENEMLLREHRKGLIKLIQTKYLKKQKDFNTRRAYEWNNRIKQINNAYELVKSFVNNTFELNRQIKNTNLKLDAQGESILSFNELIVAIGTCSNQNKLFRKTMEDSHFILDQFGENDNLTYIGIFDGYDGDVASNRCSTELHLALLESLSKKHEVDVKYLKEKFIYDEINNLDRYEKIKEGDNVVDDHSTIEKESNNQIHSDMTNNDSNHKQKNILNEKDDENDNENRKRHKIYSKSFQYAYRQMDRLLSRGKDEKSKIRWSGSTACTCIVERIANNTTNNDCFEGWIHLANCGDVEAIVVIDNANSKLKTRNFKVLTRLHTLKSCIKDREKIEKNGGYLVETSNGVKRIEGIYNITRGLGFHGDKNIKKFISSSPTVSSYKIESNYLCLIIATKGIWNALSYEKVADLVCQAFPNKKFTFQNDRATSPSVKAMLNQYYHGKRKENLKITHLNLETVIDDKNENQEECEGEDKGKGEGNNSLQSSTTKKTNSIKSINNNNDNNMENFSEPRDNNIYKMFSSSRKYLDDLNMNNSSELIITNDPSTSSPPEQNGYYTRNRPRTVPHQIFHDNSLLNELNQTAIANAKQQHINSDQIDAADFYFDDFELNNNIESREDYLDVNILNSNGFKANSDIYPMKNQHSFINETHDLKLEMNELKTIDKEQIKPINTQSKFSLLSSNENDSLENMLSYNHKNSNNKKKQIELIPVDYKGVQVSEYELKKVSRQFMTDRTAAKRLEISESLTEKIVTSALIAGATDNLTVSCVLLTGCKL